MQQLLKLTVLFALLSGCNTYKTKYPYSLDDFRPELRKHLEKVVEMGIAGAYYSKEFNEQCSIADLKKLLKCEHPLIRAEAFSLLINKDTSNIKELLLSSLDDTAIISVDHGEWGIPTMYCADYYYNQVSDMKRSKMPEMLNILFEKHPYLNITFAKLGTADSLPEKYHDAIKQMAVNVINQRGGNGAPYITYEYEKPNDILFALSKYKSKNDIVFIKDHLYYAKDNSWKIISNNPDSTYFGFVEEYYDRLKGAKKSSPESLQIAFFRQDRGKYYEDFLITLAKFKNKESAEMFSEILKERIFPNRGTIGDNEFECLLYDVLKQDSCEEFKALIQTLKPLAEGYKTKHQIPLEESTIAELRYR
ncbi:hypothetical protein [Ferruginibacter sp.]|nr:hypothetical protein [Ferruginibacter sp.]